MPSDIYVKKNTGWSTPVTSIKARTNSGWSTAIRFVFAKINQGWTRVWPYSGIFPTTEPFISNNTTTTSEINYGTVLRIGTTYKGDRGVWNPNGYTISSYNYKWIAFTNENKFSTNYQQDYSSLSGSTNAFTITGTTANNFDRGWIGFRVRANASNSAYSGIADSLVYYVARQKPVISSSPTFSSTTPSIGTVINYSSGWNTTDAYKVETNRSTIKWYRSTSISLTESQLKSLTPIQSSGYSYTVVSADSSNYIYAMEEVFNSGTDLESLVNGVTAIAKTTAVVSGVVTQSTTPSATATSNGSTTTVKYLDSITWSGGTYTNASSVASVLLYSTLSNNLVSPGGNTNSSFRSTSPYAIQTSDPAGTPYIFAVRDTVVGTNGTTYYFYSNQITCANADAVAFSYNTGVGAAGGWSATVVTSQSGASYSIPTTTGYSVNYSTGTVTATGLGSNVSSSITVTKSAYGYNSTTAPASGTSNTVTTYTLSYSANGGSSTPSQQTGAQGTSITLAANAGTRSGFTFGGWNIGGTTYSAGGSYTFGSANATATAIWTAVFVTPTAGPPQINNNQLGFVRSGTSVTWYADYPSVSGDVSYIIGMEWQIRISNSTSTTPLNTGTYASGGSGAGSQGTRTTYITYPGAGTYPYSAAGTIWAFRIKSTENTASTSSSRYARARVIMMGTNGTVYFGTWSTNI